jgi:hypothetical protein
MEVNVKNVCGDAIDGGDQKANLLGSNKETKVACFLTTDVETTRRATKNRVKGPAH